MSLFLTQVLDSGEREHRRKSLETITASLFTWMAAWRTKLGSLHCCAFVLWDPESGRLPCRGGSAAGGCRVPPWRTGGSCSPCRQLPPSEVRSPGAAPPFLLHRGHSYSTPGKASQPGVKRGQERTTNAAPATWRKHEEKERQPPSRAPSLGPHHLLSAPQAPLHPPKALWTQCSSVGVLVPPLVARWTLADLSAFSSQLEHHVLG